MAGARRARRAATPPTCAIATTSSRSTSRSPRGVLFEIATQSPGLRRRRGPGTPRGGAPPAQAARAPALAPRADAAADRATRAGSTHERACCTRERPAAGERRRGRGPAPRSRCRRARPARPRRDPRPRAAAARRHAAAGRCGSGRPGYHWYVVPRVGYPDYDTFQAAFDASSPRFHDELWGRTGLDTRADRPRRLLDGLGDELLARPGRGPARRPPASWRSRGFIPTVDGWQPELAGRESTRVFIAHGRNDPIMDVDIRAAGARPHRGRRPAAPVPRVGRRAPHRPRARPRGDEVAARHARSDARKLDCSAMRRVCSSSPPSC